MLGDVLRSLRPILFEMHVRPILWSDPQSESTTQVHALSPGDKLTF
jgi:hypothetical protein